MMNPPVYRAPMRSRRDDVPVGIAVERALAQGCCGVGGALDSPPESLAEALAAVDARHGERMARRLERFASAPVGALVWTRDTDGRLWLGRLTGDWHYDASAGAHDADLVHVRDCRWLETPIEDAAAPASVHATFARGGRNWQRIHAADVPTRTVQLWETRDAAPDARMRTRT